MNILKSFIESEEFKKICKQDNVLPLGIMLGGSTALHFETDQSDKDLDIFVDPNTYMRLKNKNRHVWQQIIFNGVKFDLFLITIPTRLTYTWFHKEYFYPYLCCLWFQKLNSNNFLAINNYDQINRFLTEFSLKETLEKYKQIWIENTSIITELHYVIENDLYLQYTYKYTYLLLYLYSLLTNTVLYNKETILTIKKLSRDFGLTINMHKHLTEPKLKLMEYKPFIKQAIITVYNWLHTGEII